MTDKAPLTRRLTLWAMLLIAFSAVPGAVYIAYSWSARVEAVGRVPEEQYRVQGLAWGAFYRNLLESWARPPQPGLGEVRMQFSETVTRRFADLLKQHPEVAPFELSILQKDPSTPQGKLLMSAPGRTLDDYPEDAAYKAFPEAALRVALVTEPRATTIIVRAPIRASALPDDLEMRCVIEYQNVRTERIRGENYYYAVIGGVFLFLLYAIFVTIYFLGRGEVLEAFRTKEKEIRLRAMGNVAEGIAHEVRNPLNAASLMVQYLEKLLSRSAQKPRAEDFQRIYFEIGKIRKVIDNFVGFAKLRELELGDCDLGAITDEAVEQFRPLFDEHAITVRVERQGDLTLVGDRPKLVQVIRTVIDHAIDAVREVAQKEISIVLVGDKKNVSLTVRDSGPSVESPTIAHLFEPFAATSRSAMGLGLTVARTVVESHGGKITAAPASVLGCTIQVTLPRSF